MISNITDSRIALKPRAPDLRSNAASATARRAESVNFSVTCSSSNSFLYCLTRAFFGLCQNPYKGVQT